MWLRQVRPAHSNANCRDRRQKLTHQRGSAPPRRSPGCPRAPDFEASPEISQGQKRSARLIIQLKAASNARCCVILSVSPRQKPLKAPFTHQVVSKSERGAAPIARGAVELHAGLGRRVRGQLEALALLKMRKTGKHEDNLGRVKPPSARPQPCVHSHEPHLHCDLKRAQHERAGQVCVVRDPLRHQEDDGA